MELNYLKYSSLITLSTNEGFYLYSQGFVDSSPYLREQTNDSFEFSGAVLRIIPQCMHSSQSSILEFIKDIREIDYYDKIAHLIKSEESLEGEIKSNIHSYEALKGEIVRYNSLIQLEHLSSHKFLTLHSKVSAEGEKNNFKISFEDFPSEYSHFRIVPSYKFQKHGSGKVRIFDKVYLEIMVPELRKLAWMHGSKGQIGDIQSGAELNDSEEAKCKAIEVNVSLDQKTRWRIGIYGELQKDAKFLACGDYIWLAMPECSVCLTVYKESWEVEKYKLLFSEKISDRNGLWMIENEDAFQGGAVVSMKKYRFKHIITGKYLAVKDQLFLKKRPTSSTLWYFQLFTNENFVKSGELCYVVNDKTKKTVQLLGNEGFILSHEKTEKCIYKPTKANGEVVWEILFLLHSYPILISFPNKITEERTFAHEDLKKIQDFRKYCDLLLQCIKNLKLFCKNRLHSMIGIDNHFGEVQRSRQLMLKQQNFFEALAKILEFAIEEKEHKSLEKLFEQREREYRLNKSDTNLPSLMLRTLAKIIKKIYTLLITMCNKNNETQLHAYKFVNVYIRHIGLDLGASKLILSILRNNEELMLGVHKGGEIDIIKYYSSMLLKFQSERKTEFLDFLKNICAYKGEGISVNQEKIFASIFKDKSIIKKSLIFTETEGNTLFIHLGSRRSDLTQCFEGGRIIGYDSEVKYFTALLDLYAHLCIGRNFESSALFIPKFPFEVLNTMIWHDSLTVTIRAAFCRFMLNMYIDCFMREEVEKPELIKIISIGVNEGPFRRQSYYTSSNGKNNLLGRSNTNIVESDHMEAFEKSRDGLNNLTRKLFDYFQNDCKPSDYLLTYELIEVVFKLIKFQEFSIKEDSIPSDDSLSIEENDDSIAEILKLIVPLLLKSGENRKKHTGSNRKRSIKKELKSGGGDISHAQRLASILKDSNSLNDPVIRSAANLKNILNSYKQNPFNGLEKKLIEHKIKLKICKMLNYYLDTRQDYLISNTVEWFNQITDYKTWKIADLDKLLPPILWVSNAVSLNSRGHQSEFSYYLEPFVPDINSLSKDSINEPIIPSLLNSFICSDNYKLQTSLLSLILRSFHQRQEMLKNIKRLHVIFKADDISLLNWIKSSLLSFKHHSEQSEIWMTYWNSNKKIQKKHKGVFEKMKMILTDIENFMYDDTHMTENGPSVPKTKSVSKSRQEMLYYLNVHKLITSLLKDGTFKLAQIYSSNKQEELSEPCELLTELFQCCHRVLKRFVFCNSRNQKKVHNFIQVLFQYLHLPLGQIPLICEIYRDNWTLISTVGESMINAFEELIVRYGRQKEFLRFLEVVQVTNGRANQDMQRMVLSLFVKEKLNNYMLFMNDAEEPEFSFEPVEKKDFLYKDEPYEYHAAVLNVISKCGLGVSGMLLNEVKCQQIISLKNIFKILLLAEEVPVFTEMKLPVLDFFYNIYIDCEITNFNLKTSQDFFEYTYLQCRKLNEISELDQPYIEFIQIWIRILSKYRAFYIKKIYTSYLEQDDLKAIRAFAETLASNSEKFEGKITRDFVEEISKLCNLFEENFEIFVEADEVRFKGESQSTFYRSSTKLDYIFSNIKQVEIWNQVKSTFTYDLHFFEKIEEEQHMLILTLHNAKKLGAGIDFERVIRSLISFIRYSRSQKPPVNILIQVIELLELILLHPMTEKAVNEDKAKENLQNEISFYGLTNVILTLMMDSQLEQQVFKALISLSVQMLSGGNFGIQQEFYQYFLTTSNSEYFFQRIHQTIQRKIDKIADIGISVKREQTVYKAKTSSMKKILEFLQLLCENHNQPLQNYIRYQEKSQISYNLIASVISLLDILIIHKNPSTFYLISHCFIALTEFIQGPCLENQVEVINSNFIDITRNLLSIDESTLMTYRNLILESVKTEENILTESSDAEDESRNMPGWMIGQLKFRCLITFLSLFEGRKDNLVVTRMIRSLNLEILKENLKYVHSEYLSLYWNHEYDEGLFNNFLENETCNFKGNQTQNVDRRRALIIENGFLIYQLLRTMQDTEDPEIQETLESELSDIFQKETQKTENTENTENTEDSEKKFENSFQIQDADSSLTAAYKFFESYTGNIEVVFHGEIFRLYFYYPPEYKGLSKEIKEDFHRFVIRDSDQSKLKYMLDKSEVIIPQIRHEFRIKNFINKSKFKILFKVLTQVDLWRRVAFLLTIVLNLIILTSYSADRNYESLFTYTPDDIGLGKNDTVALLKLFGLSQLVCCILIVAFFLLKVGPLLAKKGWERRAPSRTFLLSKPNWFKRYAVKLQQVCLTILYVLKNGDVIYYVLYAVFSILGITVHPFYFSLLLLDIVYRYPSLQNVVNSIVLPREALLLTFLLMLVIVYIYAILGYWLFEDYFNPNCKSLAQCLLTVWDKSFKYDGGIGGFLGIPVTPTYDPLRFFYDNVYFLLVMVVLMGVVQGIIIDTFARLREGQETCNQDRENKCFICGLGRDYIEKKHQKGFSHHIQNDHNEWDYILFLAYLQAKETTEYTGFESYVSEQVSGKELAWIPNHAALSIHTAKEDKICNKVKILDHRLEVLRIQAEELNKH